jgi:hypothetical protein
LLNGCTVTPSTTNVSGRSFRHHGASAFAGALTVLLALLLLSATPAAAETLAIDPGQTFFDSSTVTIGGTKQADSTIRVPSLVGGDPYCIESGAQTTWSCTFNIADGEWNVVVFEDLATDPPTTTQTQVTIRVLGPPTIDGLAPVVTTGLISGTGLPGAGIVISGLGAGADGYCTTVQSPSGYWSCPLPITASGDYAVTAQQTWPGSGEAGGVSAAKTIRVDKDPPALPIITQPTSGQRITGQPVRIGGIGEDGARVDAFVDGVLVCSSGVVASRWFCDASIPLGEHSVQGIQWDAAGNPSGASTGIPITVASAPSTPIRPGSPGTTTPGAPGAPAPSPTPTPSRTPAPAPDSAFPFFPPPVGGDSGLPPGDTWGTPTDYGAAIPRLAEVARNATWLLGIALGIGFIVLIALPLRLLTRTLAGRFTWRPTQFAGRNQQFDDADETPLVNPWVTAAGALTAAVLLAALAGGIQAEVRYLRLVFAIGLALAVLNGVGVALAAKGAGRAAGWVPGIRLVPLFLTVAAVTALISRGGGIQPPIIVGVVIAFAAGGIRPAARGKVALGELAAITLLALGAWLAHSAIGPVEGFWLSLTSEALAALCIAALGSAMLLLLPVSGMPGRLLFEWSLPAWLAVTLVAASLASIVVAGSPTFPLPWVVGIAFAFATVSVATWSWIRFVEPQLVTRDA